jgi:hypothetical protein
LIELNDRAQIARQSSRIFLASSSGLHAPVFALARRLLTGGTLDIPPGAPEVCNCQMSVSVLQQLF